MQNALTSYQFDEKPVRVVMIDGDPWFVAVDVAMVLGYREAERLTRNLDDDEKGPHIVGTLGGEQAVTIISESGLYAAILKSRRPEARRFRKWVTAEVLPAIRRGGSYALPGRDAPAEIAEDYDPVQLNAKVAVVREARRLFGPGRARTIWTTLGLPLGLTGPKGGDDLAGALHGLLAQASEPLTTAEIAGKIGLDPDSHEARRRVTELLRLQGWHVKRVRRGAALAWAWFPALAEAA